MTHAKKQKQRKFNLVIVLNNKYENHFEDNNGSCQTAPVWRWTNDWMTELLYVSQDGKQLKSHASEVMLLPKISSYTRALPYWAIVTSITRHFGLLVSHNALRSPWGIRLQQYNCRRHTRNKWRFIKNLPQNLRNQPYTLHKRIKTNKITIKVVSAIFNTETLQTWHFHLKH